ncbi:MAG TPA: FtsQ-type POTRA domain-containing protein [Candidatus Eisenbacteria bacterium]|nr:FtsQ-type POTRA domain-containing protein [Candidatus Eisenbacteria bacterium]
MSLYQGRALRREHAARPHRSGHRIALVLRMLVALTVAAALTQLPWRTLLSRVARVDEVRVQGAHYLDATRIEAVAGVRPGLELLGLDLARARQRLLLHPRIAAARVTRDGARGVRILVTEREPVLLVAHGAPWEVDSAGVLLAPLAAGEVADVPMLTGPDYSRLPAGARLETQPVRRGLAWVQALGARELALDGQVSEIDVSDPGTTGVLLMSGTRVLSTAWPPDPRTLSALRVVLSDLKQRGTPAEEVDLRFANQVIVRPVAGAAPEAATAARTKG